VTHLHALPGPPSAPGTLDELEGLFREHYDRVFRTSCRITGSAVDAEDVLQTVFLRLARRSGGVNLEPNPGSYLHRAAINASLDLVRRRGRSPQVGLDEIGAELRSNPRLDPEAQQLTRELRGVIQSAVAGLGEKTAEVFILRYFEGYDNREIAALLGTSQIVVGVLLHRGRARVKKQVGEFLEGNHEAK
jgi:RNA polymerase sigma-70 factor (ECF subfamily)